MSGLMNLADSSSAPMNMYIDVHKYSSRYAINITATLAHIANAQCRSYDGIIHHLLKMRYPMVHVPPEHIQDAREYSSLRHPHQ
jgi:hypothetical protein